MMKLMDKFKSFILLLLLFCSSILLSQKNDDDIATEEVVVIKSYTPILNEAFKIKSAPIIPNSVFSPKKNILYKFKDIPVVSTFQPNKASPLKLKQRKSSIPFNTIFSGAYGNSFCRPISYSNKRGTR